MAVARSTPGSAHMETGHPIKIALTDDPDISFWEQSVTPPGVEGGDEIDITTQFNTALRTKAPRALSEHTEMTLTALYDPTTYSQILAVVNDNQLWTVHFPDTSTIDFYGWLKSFVPSETEDGTAPAATVTMVVSNRDNASPPVETGPAYTAPV